MCSPFDLRNRTQISDQGSGKTLAYGLPILQKLLSGASPTSARRPVKALILAPTRELALQVSEHLNAVVKTEDQTERIGPRPPPPVSIAAIVGGMSIHKQKRILERGVDVLIATPGRLWDILQEVCLILHPPHWYSDKTFTQGR